jgi:hypothetical protein
MRKVNGNVDCPMELQEGEWNPMELQEGEWNPGGYLHGQVLYGFGAFLHKTIDFVISIN